MHMNWHLPYNKKRTDDALDVWFVLERALKKQNKGMGNNAQKENARKECSSTAPASGYRNRRSVTA